MSGGEFVGPAVKVGVAAARPAAGWFRRKVRPDTSRLSSEGSVDNLADAVELMLTSRSITVPAPAAS